MIRAARLGDEKAILALVRELALYERAPEAVVNTSDQLRKDLFEDSICAAWVVELEGDLIGFALYYKGYSTWKGATLYLEDFYVKPDFRKQGWGQRLFDKVVETAKSWGVKRMDWQVLDWNEIALKFYRRNQAELDGEWVNGRLYF